MSDSGIENGRIDWDWVQNRLDEQFGCTHTERQLRVRTLKNGAQVFVRQCLRCGEMHAVKKTSLTFVQKHSAPAADEDIRPRYFAEKAAYRKVLVDDILEQAQADRAAWYAEYLRSDAWKRRRTAVLRRDNHLCQSCLCHPASQVHHLTYTHIGQEPLFDLVAVCDRCHRLLHPDKQEDDPE